MIEVHAEGTSWVGKATARVDYPKLHSGGTARPPTLSSGGGLTFLKTTPRVDMIVIRMATIIARDFFLIDMLAIWEHTSERQLTLHY
ncbi:hypothetical protein CsatB_018693 [Cannabis sativa]